MALGLVALVVALLLLVGAVATTVWVGADAHRRTGNGTVAAVAAVAVFFTFPLGPLVYLLVRQHLVPSAPVAPDSPA